MFSVFTCDEILHTVRGFDLTTSSKGWLKLSSRGQVINGAGLCDLADRNADRGSPYIGS